MPNPRLYAGQVLTADRHNELIPQLITQESDHTVTNSTVFQDTEISVTLEPNAIYLYNLLISYSAAAAADIMWQWSLPIGITIASFSIARHYDATTTGSNAGADVILRRAGGATDKLAGGEGTDLTTVWSAYDQGTLQTDASVNTITLQVAQRVANATGSILRGASGTRMTYQRIA